MNEILYEYQVILLKQVNNKFKRSLYYNPLKQGLKQETTCKVVVQIRL